MKFFNERIKEQLISFNLLYLIDKKDFPTNLR